MNILELRENYTAGCDNDLLLMERETHINFDDEMTNDGYVKIDSSQRLTIKALMKNDCFALNDYHTKGDEVIYIAGTLPLSCLRIKGTSKGRSTLSYVLRS